MTHSSPSVLEVEVQPLAAEAFRAYGWMLGKSIPEDADIPAFRSRDLDFWQEHVFDAGAIGQTQVLWVNYRNRQSEVTSLEAHRLCQQAVVPLTGAIIQVVAQGGPEGSPDMSTIRAFRVRVGEGLCMRAGCWHTTRVDVEEAKCLMLTRRSTTDDLVAHLRGEAPLGESAITPLGRKVKLIR